MAQEAAIRDAVSGTAKGINSFLEALGSKARLSGYSAGLETSGKGRGGVFAGGIFEDGRTFGESGKGDNYAQTLYEKFSTNNPDFKQALADFTLDLKQSTIQALQTVSDIPESIKKMLKDVDAEGLSEEAANALLESINAQIVGVNQFKTALDAMGMDELAKLSFDAAAGLAEVSGGFDKLLGNLNTYYSNFFSPEEQRANVQRQLEEQFKGLGLKLPDINDKDARAKYRALVESASKDMSEEGRKTYATLLALSGAFAGVTSAAEDTTETLRKQQEDLREAGYSALERAIGAERKALESQLDVARDVADTVGSIFDLLHSNVLELYGEVDSTRAAQAQRGNDFITQALATARSSGYLPDADQLAEAISAARTGISSGQGYTSQFEVDRDRLVLAGKLSGLEEITGKQLTDSQRTVKELEGQTEQLDRTLAYWREQIDIANGTYKATLSVKDAIKELQALMFPDVATNKPAVVGSAGGAGFGPGAGGGSAAAPGKYGKAVATIGGVGTVYDYEKDAKEIARLDALAPTFDKYRGTSDLAGLSAEFRAAGGTPEDLARFYGFSEADVNAALDRAGIPRFDVGTDYVPKDMLAMVHEGEKIVPKAYNPAANPGMGSSNADLIAEVRALRETVASLMAAAAETASNTRPLPQLGRQFDTVSNGGTVLRNKAVPA